MLGHAYWFAGDLNLLLYVCCAGQLHLASNAGLASRTLLTQGGCRTGCVVGSGEGMLRGLRTQRLSKSKQVSKLAEGSADMPEIVQ